MKPLLALILPALLLAGCRADAGASAAGARIAGAPGGEHAFMLVQILTGPKSGQPGKEETERAFAGHFANMERMANEGQLVVAGPYGDDRHDHALRGLFVLDSGDRAQAESWAGTDPTTQAGVFRLELHELGTDAPLARALEADRAWRAGLKAAGKTPSPGEGLRAWVLLTAEHGDLARQQLAPLCTAAGGVCLLASLDGTRALALLDASDAASARARFAPQLAALGSFTLDDWYASDQLAHLPAWRAE
ncbi:MAG TPA: YciI family protein [Planctomycetota bacterium]|nr:YciI family protein [Planctomycetota bacterium]